MSSAPSRCELLRDLESPVLWWAEGGAGGGCGGDLREVEQRRRIWATVTEEAPRRRWRRRRRAVPGLEEELAEEGLEQGREPAAGRWRTGELRIFTRFIQRMFFYCDLN
uniref:Uncharacterized protein n=1 Tax=Leersia perrieri TaxID=77586 RepID=A0A0D9XBT4_9ORYZ